MFLRGRVLQCRLCGTYSTLEFSHCQKEQRPAEVKPEFEGSVLVVLALMVVRGGHKRGHGL